MPAISVLLKPSSSMCNMSCDYCFYCDEAAKRSEASYGFMTEATLKNIIRRTMLRAEHSISFAFQGGEPTLRGIDFFRRAVELEQQYNKNHLQVSNAFQTNGYALDEDWCHFLADNHFLVGLSIDGTREIHDSLRHTKSGEATFSQIARAAALLDQYGVEYNILTVVTKKVADHIDEIYDFYAKKGWRFQQYIACLDPLDAPHGLSGHALLPEDYGRFLIRLFSRWSQDLESGRQPYIRQFENYVALAMGRQAESCDMRGTCGIQYVCEADGSVYPCDFYMLDPYKLGNFNTDLLPAIDEKRRELGFLERSQKLASQCQQCPYHALCRGGCQRNRDLNEKTGLYENYFCPAYRMFFEASYDRLMEIGQRILHNTRR